jgi:hypothetical protein
MGKTISHTALRRQLGVALQPIRVAMHSTEDGAHMPVVFAGYRFTGSRLYKAKGQVGYVWKANYSGVPCTDWTENRWPTSTFGSISGTLDECAAQMHSRLRAEEKAEGVAA